MGVENGLLSDLQIVVSSVLDDREEYYGKHNIRLHTQPDSFLSAGVWVAKPKPDQFVRVSVCCSSLSSNLMYDPLWKVPLQWMIMAEILLDYLMMIACLYMLFHWRLSMKTNFPDSISCLLQFDFSEPSLVSGVVTQGHPASPEWVESFTVRYSPDGESWNTIKEPDGTKKVRHSVCWWAVYMSICIFMSVHLFIYLPIYITICHKM